MSRLRQEVPSELRPITRLLRAGLAGNVRFRTALRLMRGVARLGLENAPPFPPELLAMGARVLGQGYLNRVGLPLLDGWLVPGWMREQADPDSPGFTPRSVHNLMVNQTRRNWTALGLPGASHPVESVVDGRGLLTPTPAGPSLDWWAEVDGAPGGPMSATSQPSVVQRLQGGLPVIVTAFEAGGLRVQSEAWMLGLPRGDWAAMQVVLFNIADMTLTGTFRFALRPFNPEGIAPVYSVEYDGRTLRADGRPGPLTWPRPGGYRLSTLRAGDLFSGSAGIDGERADDPHGFAHGVLEYRFQIEPWEEAEFVAFVPVRRARAGVRARPFRTHEEEASPLFSLASASSLPHPFPRDLAYSRAKAATMLEWQALLDGGMRLTLPERELQESWEASRLHVLSLHDGPTITPGPDLYHAYWLRDAALMAHALSVSGFADAARRLLLGFRKFQRREGDITSHTSEWDGTGQALWAIGRHLDLYPDPALLATLTPLIESGARWIVRMLERHGGAMPAGISSEHFGPPDHYYWDNLWSLAGLESAGALLGLPPAAAAARALRSRLESALGEDATRLGGAVPGAPRRDVTLASTGTLAAWYPLGLLSPADPTLAATLAEVRRTLFYDGALFVNTGHSGWATYINMRLAGCLLLSGDTEGWALMRRVLGLASPTLNWPEALHPHTGGGSTGDGHHGWASAEWLMLVRLLILREEGERLHIAPFAPSSWFERDGAIELAGAPTRFGPVSYRLEWDEEGKVAFDLAPSWRTPPSEVVLRLPPGAAQATADGEPGCMLDGAIVLAPGARRVEAVVERDGD